MKRSRTRKGEALDRAGLFDVTLIGLLAGFLVSLAAGRRRGVLAELTLGLAGAFVGELAAQALDIPGADSCVGVSIAAILGASVLTAAFALIGRRASPKKERLP